MSENALLNRSQIPATIAEAIGQAVLTPVRSGDSAAEVYRVEGIPPRYLKVSAFGAIQCVRQERLRLQWLGGRVSVPQILHYGETGTHQYLLMSAIEGNIIYNLGLPAQAIVQRLADAAQRFHQLPVAECPFDWRLQTQVARAEDHVARGLVRQERFTPDVQGQTPQHILEAAQRLLPRLTPEDLVVVHGDMYPINMHFDPQSHQLNGYIDVGRCGVGDRYVDLALIVRTFAWHLDASQIHAFFEAYGLAEIDHDKLRFYQLLYMLL